MEQLFGSIVKAIADAGPIAIALGFAIFGVWALGTGRVRVGRLVDDDRKELRDELEDWKALAQDITPELKRLNDLLDTAVKLLLDPGRRPPPSS